jgi:hypothetical protein
VRVRGYVGDKVREVELCSRKRNPRLYAVSHRSLRLRVAGLARLPLRARSARPCQACRSLGGDRRDTAYSRTRVWLPPGSGMITAKKAKERISH